MKNKQIIIGAVTGMAIVFIFSTLVIEKRLSDTLKASAEIVSAQEETTVTLAKDIAAGKAPELARNHGVITDCPFDESQKYDQLLSSLDTGLSQPELLALENLFNQCGSIPAVSRAFMTYLLEQEVETLAKLMEQHLLLGEDLTTKINLTAWRELAVKEKEINVEFYALVVLQGKIIDALQAETQGNIDSIQREVQEVQQKYASAIVRASELRSTLITP